MPIPVLLPPAVLGPAAGASIKVATRLAIDYAPTTVSVSLATVLARRAWKRIPSWIKEDEAFRNLVAAEDSSDCVGDDNDNNNNERKNDMLSLTAVVDKLQALVAVGSEKLAQDEFVMAKTQLQAAVLCYIQLAMQLRNQRPDARNELYLETEKKNVVPQVINEGATTTATATKNNEVCWNEIRDGLDFSVWAYDEVTEELRDKLESKEFFLLQHSDTAKMPPGHVGHYVAISPEQRTLLVAVKGTSTLEDILTDCCGRATTYYMEKQPFADDEHSISQEEIHIMEHDDDDIDGDHDDLGNNEEDDSNSGTRSAIEVTKHDGINIRCHEGILISAKRLADKVHDIVNQLCSSSDGYKLVLCGHSLGAGTASLLSIILRSRFPWLQEEKNRMKVYAYACPPVLDYDAAQACTSFCTTVVNNSDIIPRSSLANLRTFLHFLKSVHAELVQQRLSPTGVESWLALLRKLSQGTKGDLLMTQEKVSVEIQAAQERIGLQDPEHLYVPGRVILLYERWESIHNGADGAGAGAGAGDGDNLGGSKPSCSVEDDDDKNKSADYQGEIIKKCMGAPGDIESSSSTTKKSSQLEICTLLTNGTTRALRFFEIDRARMITDHLTVSYYNSINALLSREDLN